MPGADHSAKIAHMETQDEELSRRDDAILARLQQVESKMNGGFEKLGDQIRSVQIR